VIVDLHHEDREETDRERQESRPLAQERVEQARGAPDVARWRNFQVEHQQRNRDRGDAVAKRLDSLGALLGCDLVALRGRQRLPGPPAVRERRVLIWRTFQRRRTGGTRRSGLRSSICDLLAASDVRSLRYENQGALCSHPLKEDSHSDGLARPAKLRTATGSSRVWSPTSPTWSAGRIRGNGKRESRFGWRRIRGRRTDRKAGASQALPGETTIRQYAAGSISRLLSILICSGMHPVKVLVRVNSLWPGMPR